MYRGACRHCGWEGEPREDENTAAEGCDHAWPGWREVPVVAAVPEERNKRAALVLDDIVPGNGESWFLARVFEAEVERGLRDVVSFADPVPRQIDGRVLFAGHTSHVYVASTATYLGRATSRTLIVLSTGAVLPAGSAQKVRAGERGHAHVERHLVDLGATPRRPHTYSAAWLAAALHEVGATRIRHGGNHRHAFRLGRTARLRSRVRLGMSELPRPRSIDQTPPDQLALFASNRPTKIVAMPATFEDRA